MPLVLTKTRTELKEQVGLELELLESAQSSLSPEDDALIESIYDPVLMMLSREGWIIFDITDDDAIDAASFLPIALIMAGLLSGRVGLPPRRIAEIVARADKAETTLRRMIFDGPNDDVTSTDYF